MSKNIRSIEQVFEALGNGDQKAGRAVLVKITGKLTQHVTNWISEGYLPRYTYLVVQQALTKKRRGYKLDPAVCRVTPMKPKRKRKPRAATAVSQSVQERASA